MTLGVMQVRTHELINDSNSVRIGVRKLIEDLAEIKEKKEIERTDVYRDWEVLSKLIEKFNGGKSYNSEVSDLFWLIWNKFYDGQTNASTFEE